MSADRPLSERYDEPVFSEKPWSPTVAEVLTLLKLSQGEELPAPLITSFVRATNLDLKEEVRGLLETHNKLDPRMRKATGSIAMQSARLSMLHSQDSSLSEQDIQARNSVLITAIAVVGLQSIREI